jgi:hypothetical protein
VVARVGINQRVSLRKFIDDIRRWVEEDRSDEWIASALGTSPSSYEGVLEPEGPGIWFDPEISNDPRWHKRWKSIERVELRLTPTRIVFLRRGSVKGPAASS